jgi:hypothetical protein
VARNEQELFLLRIWAEPRELPGQPAVYRGFVEHVRSSRSTYLRELGQVVPFVRSCLDHDGVLPPGGFAEELDG